jgi:hypothetical protein
LPHLEYLDLSGCVSLLSDAVRHISRIACNLKTLLLNHCNELTDEAIESIADHCKNLEHVSLKLEMDSPLSGSALHLLLGSCSSLTKLQFCYHSKTESFFPFAVAMNKPIQIRCLRVMGFDVARISDLLLFVDVCPKLCLLSLQSQEVTPGVLGAIQTLLRKLYPKINVYLSSDYIDHSVFKDMRSSVYHET